MIVIGVEGANQGEEEPSHHHVAPGMSSPHEPSQDIVALFFFEPVCATPLSSVSSALYCTVLEAS
jgi:hypothetical protein